MTAPTDRAEAIALQPCPFCNGEAFFERVGDSSQTTVVECKECGCFLESGETWNAGTKWNTRTATVEIEQLRAENAEWQAKVQATAQALTQSAEDARKLVEMATADRARKDALLAEAANAI